MRFPRKQNILRNFVLSNSIYMHSNSIRVSVFAVVFIKLQTLKDLVFIFKHLFALTHFSICMEAWLHCGIKNKTGNCDFFISQFLIFIFLAIVNLSHYFDKV